MLLTRAPLYSGLPPFAYDLHVLGTPPAFVLSQDQTLQLVLLSRSCGNVLDSVQDLSVPHDLLFTSHLVFKEPPP